MLWHAWSAGAPLKHVRHELVWFRKCNVRRPKDLVDVKATARLPLVWEPAVISGLYRRTNGTDRDATSPLNACMAQLSPRSTNTG